MWNKAQEIISSALTFGINPSLEPMQCICALLGNPEEQYLCIQVAGTNGKSSTSRYLAALLGATNKKVGLYTSPELTCLTDRIEIDGEPVSKEDFAQAIVFVFETAKAERLELTEFELITAAALCLFASKGIDYAVLEVGLGGRWDATSVVDPALAVITSVDLDHTAVLGTTISEIAAEKAALIKKDSMVVMAPLHKEAKKVVCEQAALTGAELHEVGLARGEQGSYQAQNKLTAYTAFSLLLPQEKLDKGLAQEIMDGLIIPGRLETLSTDPLLIIDAAHNPASAELLAKTIHMPTATLLLGVLADKDAVGIIRALCPHFAQTAVTQSASPRAIAAHELTKLVELETGLSPEEFSSPSEALDELRTQNLAILATGSITLAGEVKKAFLQQKL